MTRLNRAAVPLGTLAVALFLTTPPSSAAEDFVTAVNPQTGRTESVWVGPPNLFTPSEVRHTVLVDEDWIPAERVTSDATADHQPVLSFAANGDRRIAWWKSDATERVLYATQPAAGGPWSAPVLVSDPAVNSRTPRFAEMGGQVFIVYEELPALGVRRIVVAGGDGSDPWPRTIVATVNSLLPTSASIEVEGTRLWVHWVDSSTRIAWSSYANGTWGSVQTEPYAGLLDVDAALGRIHDKVVQ